MFHRFSTRDAESGCAEIDEGAFSRAVEEIARILQARILAFDGSTSNATPRPSPPDALRAADVAPRSVRRPSLPLANLLMREQLQRDRDVLRGGQASFRGSEEETGFTMLSSRRTRAGMSVMERVSQELGMLSIDTAAGGPAGKLESSPRQPLSSKHERPECKRKVERKKMQHLVHEDEKDMLFGAAQNAAASYNLEIQRCAAPAIGAIPLRYGSSPEHVMKSITVLLENTSSVEVRADCMDAVASLIEKDRHACETFLRLDGMRLVLGDHTSIRSRCACRHKTAQRLCRKALDLLQLLVRTAPHNEQRFSDEVLSGVCIPLRDSCTFRFLRLARKRKHPRYHECVP